MTSAQTFKKFLSVADEVYIIYKSFQVMLDQICLMIILHGHRCSLSPSFVHVPTPIMVAIETYNTH